MSRAGWTTPPRRVKSPLARPSRWTRPNPWPRRPRSSTRAASTAPFGPARSSAPKATRRRRKPPTCERVPRHSKRKNATRVPRVQPRRHGCRPRPTIYPPVLRPVPQRLRAGPIEATAGMRQPGPPVRLPVPQRALARPIGVRAAMRQRGSNLPPESWRCLHCWSLSPLCLMRYGRAIRKWRQP